MEKDSGSFFNQQHLHQLPSDRNLFDFPHLVEDSASRTVPLIPFLGMQQWNATQPNDSLSWFYGLTHSQLAFAPLFNSPFTEKPISGPCALVEKGKPTLSAPARKQFLVFDHYGDKTTFVYTAGVETPTLKPPPTAFNKGAPADILYPLRPITYTEHVEDNSGGDIMEDEMHEDTEELNALLYSDSDDYSSEDEEETSTAHSPSTMTDNGLRELIEEEEVDSYDSPNKRRKLSEDGESSSKSHVCSGSEHDVGSHCGERSRKERIRETVSVLQDMIPSTKGKDAIVVIDEAIHYLKSLKVKAKALGLDPL